MLSPPPLLAALALALRAGRTGGLAARACAQGSGFFLAFLDGHFGPVPGSGLDRFHRLEPVPLRWPWRAARRRRHRRLAVVELCHHVLLGEGGHPAHLLDQAATAGPVR